MLNIVTAGAVVMLGFILNSMRDSLKAVSADLKLLNDSVLSKYMTRDEVDDMWRDTRRQVHDLAGKVQVHEVELAIMRTKKD